MTIKSYIITSNFEFSFTKNHNIKFWIPKNIQRSTVGIEFRTFDWKIMIHNQWNKIIIRRIKINFQSLVSRWISDANKFLNSQSQSLHKCRCKIKLDGKIVKNYWKEIFSWWRENGESEQMIWLFYCTEKINCLIDI